MQCNIWTLTLQIVFKIQHFAYRRQIPFPLFLCSSCLAANLMPTEQHFVKHSVADFWCYNINKHVLKQLQYLPFHYSLYIIHKTPPPLWKDKRQNIIWNIHTRSSTTIGSCRFGRFIFYFSHFNMPNSCCWALKLVSEVWCALSLVVTELKILLVIL